MIETERLILRPWREDDAEALYQYASDPDVGPPAGWPPHTSVENSRDIIRTVFSAPETYAVCLKDGTPIGSIGLMLSGSTDMTNREDECELGYWIGKPFWGRGLIPEAAREILRRAFEDLGMRTVWCGYYEGNIKSRRVQDKLGFVYHHTTRGLKLNLLGEIRTGHVMIMTKEMWKEAVNMPYKVEVKERWGDTAAYKEHTEKTAHYTPNQWQQATDEMNAVFAKFAACKNDGHSPASPEAKSLVKELQDHITARYYTCTNQILSGLGQMYTADARFTESIDRNGAGTARFVSDAITAYCK